MFVCVRACACVCIVPPIRSSLYLYLSVHLSLSSSSVLFCLTAYTRSPVFDPFTLWAVSNGVLLREN